MRATTIALFSTSVFLATACLGSGEQFANDNPADCGPGRYWSDKDQSCLPNPADAGSDSGSGGASGASGGGGAGGSAGASGSGGASGAGGTGGAAGSGGSGGSSGSGGSGGSLPDAGKPDGAPSNCAPPDQNGTVMVTFRVLLTANDVPATFKHDFDGKWNPTYVSSEKVEIQAYTVPALRRLNAELKGGRWLVEGSPSLKLSVPVTAIEVWFGCAKAPPVYELKGGKMPAYSVGYGKLLGEPGPNLFFCVIPSGCYYALAP